MKIAIIGTGMVGRALAGRLTGLGHEVVLGTRDVDATIASTETGALGTPPYSGWQAEHEDVRLLSFSDAGAYGEVVINATAGAASLTALEATGAHNLAGKLLIDLAIPLDLSEGMPPKLMVASTDSLGEQIQRAFPDAHVVKTLHTVFVEVMIDPGRVPGEHTIFVAGESADAKRRAKGILNEFGWPAERIIDLGGIKSARSTEMYAQLYFNLVGVFGTFDFNIQVTRTPEEASRAR
jgi:predicted dinucleotide-binding enzyme